MNFFSKMDSEKTEILEKSFLEPSSASETSNFDTVDSVSCKILTKVCWLCSFIKHNSEARKIEEIRF